MLPIGSSEKNPKTTNKKKKPTHRSFHFHVQREYAGAPKSQGGLE